MIPFNKPYVVGDELAAIASVIEQGHLSGDGAYTKKCSSLLEKRYGAERALLTHSCTSALEISALQLDLQLGDEVIVPSYTFVSTANAFVLAGAKIVFVDVRRDTLNIDETKIEQAITSKTKAIVVVHYAGVACEMDSILSIAKHYGLSVIEDAAQAIEATYNNIPLGTMGRFGAFSFHETKNISCGEGGALLVNASEDIARAEIMREKGTDRSLFLRGEVDKYSWKDIGSSYLPSELLAGFLSAQLSHVSEITSARLKIWNQYYRSLLRLQELGFLTLPNVPQGCEHNGHIFYVILSERVNRSLVIQNMKTFDIWLTSHYVPLHSSQAGKKFGEASGCLSMTNGLSGRVLRFPVWVGLKPAQVEEVVEKFEYVLRNASD